MPVPSEKRSIEAMKRVQSMNGAALESAIDGEIGTPMMTVFTMLARHLLPEADDDEIAKSVHLMVLAYLLRVDVDAKKPKAQR